MQVINSLEKNNNLSLALGFFDGVHCAHKKLILKTVELAKANNIKSAVITFKESPYCVLSGNEPEYITSNEDKIKLIEEFGVDYLYILDFNKVKNLTADEYLNDIIIKNFNPKFILTGFNHTFGKNKTGDSSFLIKNARNYAYFELNKIDVEDKIVSSTNVRKFIKEGKIESANKMLERNFSITNKVVKGAQIARKLGFKTANLIWPEKIVKPKYGVYKGCVIYNNKKYDALVNFGVRPSIDKTLTETLEAHIINFDKEIYDEIVTVEFVSKIRDEIKFNSYDELKAQIESDYNSIIK